MISTPTKRSPRTEGGGDFAPALGGGSGAKRTCGPRGTSMGRARSGSQANRGVNPLNSPLNPALRAGRTRSGLAAREQECLV